MSGKFKVKSIKNLKDLSSDSIIEESDFALQLADDRFVQFEYVDQDTLNVEKYTISSGLYSIDMMGNQLCLKIAKFTEQTLLESYVNTANITNKINTFFNKIDIYKKYGLDPKRAMLLYGPPGAGKSVAISKVTSDYAKSTDTTIVIWPSDKFEAAHVKDFIKRFEYDTNGIKKFILIIEDLGGVEQTGHGQRHSESSLLSLLDNVEQTFKVPTMIVATTNFPENFLENLTDRPQRFDDLIEVKRPDAEFRALFLKFFSQDAASLDDLKKIQEKKYEVFSVAHIKEVVIRSALYDITIKESMDQLLKQSEKVHKAFSNRKGMGIQDYGE